MYDLCLAFKHGMTSYELNLFQLIPLYFTYLNCLNVAVIKKHVKIHILKLIFKENLYFTNG